MFFRTKCSGNYQYLQIVHNTWDKEKGRPRQQVLVTLGRLDQLKESGQLESLLKSGARFSEKLMILTQRHESQTLRVTTRRIGPLMVFQRLWKESGCQEVLRELLTQRYFEHDVEHVIFISVLHRLLESGSDRQCNKWRLDYSTEENENKEIKLKLHHFYRAMSWLGEPLVFEHQQDGIIPFSPRCTKDYIEEKLFSHRRTLFSSLKVVFFDTTSIYFEGEGGEFLGRYGNSKDHRPDRKQVVVGVVLDDSGYPLCCEMWPGNTTDVTTLIPIIKRLKKRFQIRQVCIVSDRGMVSRDVMEWLETEKWPYILGVRMRNKTSCHVLSRPGRYRRVRTNVNGNVNGQERTLHHPPPGKNNDKEEEEEKLLPLKVKEVSLNGHRYIVCLNESQAKKDSADRQAILDSLKKKLKGGAQSLLGNRGYRRYIKSLSRAFQIDMNKVESEQRYDGKWILRTNTTMDAEQVALKYKELWQVEQLFRSIKTLVNTRPVFHRNDAAIRGHIFCSFLSLILMKELKERLTKKGFELEWNDVVRDLNALEEVEVEQDGKHLLLRSEVKGCCGNVFKAVGIAIPPTIRQCKRVKID